MIQFISFLRQIVSLLLVRVSLLDQAVDIRFAAVLQGSVHLV